MAGDRFSAGSRSRAFQGAGLLTRARALLLIAASISLIFLAAAPGASARVPKVFWGIVPQAEPTLAQLQRVKKGGADSERITITWASVQPSAANPPDFSAVDQAVERASRAGLELLPVIYGSPAWISRPENTLPVRTAKQRSAWKSLIRRFVDRYGPSGSFWSQNPGVPKHPIRYLQPWNEENFFYFAKRPSPSQYGTLVKISHQAIAAADPRVKLILGGMFALPAERPPKAYSAAVFLSKMYRTTPGVKASFDGVALHPYTRSYKYLAPEIAQVRAVMKGNGDSGTGLWITELGWGSGHGHNSFEKGPKGQVRQLKGAFRVLRNNRRKWRIKRVFWFSLDDHAGACNFCGSTGLFRAGFKPKPAWYAYSRFTGGNPNARVSGQLAPRAFAARPDTLLYEHPAGWPGP